MSPYDRGSSMIDYQNNTNNSDTVNEFKVISGIWSQRAQEDTLSCLGSALESCGTSQQCL